jgi:ribonuclease HII
LSAIALSSEKPTLQREIALFEQGYHFVAGLDEAGRGAWAGPVVAAAVILPLAQPELSEQLAGLNDSKKLSPSTREHFFDLIKKTAIAVAVGMASPQLVDEVNVLEATRRAMQQAVAQLAVPAQYLLLDHVKLSALSLPQQAFPKADTLSMTVAAASIIAKVTRDRLMVQLNEVHPGYRFDRHKGYGTAIHRAALTALGPCLSHRISYKPLQLLTRERVITNA